MTTKTIKTVLFASLIAALLLPFGMMNTVFAETISDEIVEPRSFSLVNHNVFQSYVDLPREDNAWNNVMIKENIKNYNIESKIGHDVDGYELLALHAQEQILQKNYNPSLVEEKLYDWAISQYDLPNDKKGIQDRIIEVVDQNHLGHAKQIADSLVRLAELGVVSPDIHKADPSFWDAVIFDSYCSMTTDCGQKENPLWLVSYNDAPITRVAYVNHVATINATYEYCNTSGNTCNTFKTHNGSGQLETNFNPPNDYHIGDPYIYVSMTNWSNAGDNVYTKAQVTWPTAGTALIGTDNDGYVSKNGNLSNPSSGSWTIPNIK